MSTKASSLSPSKCLDWPSDGLERVEHCPICGHSERKRLYADQPDRVFRVAPGRWNLYQCAICRTAYLDPRPTPSTIHLAYRNYYTHKLANQPKADGISMPRRLVASLANGYRNRRYNANLKPASPLGPYLVPILGRYRNILDRELRYLPPLKTGARLLDVGFGNGSFMLLAQRIGWHVLGVDPDHVAVANAKTLGLDVRHGGIGAFSGDQEKFNVITINHAIEHVHDPIETLRQAYRLLKPDGLLYIATPNIEAQGHLDFKQHWRGLEVPRHLMITNWDAMCDLLFKVGFAQVTKVSIPTPYAALASASRAIREGQDPNIPRAPSTVDKIRAAIRSFTMSGQRKTEFITLYAHKSVLK